MRSSFMLLAAASSLVAAQHHHHHHAHAARTVQAEIGVTTGLSGTTAGQDVAGDVPTVLQASAGPDTDSHAAPSPEVIAVPEQQPSASTSTGSPLIRVTPDNLALTKTLLGFTAPSTLGGNMTFAFANDDDAQALPLNTIISSHSWFSGGGGDGDALRQELGFAQYLTALNMSGECLGIHVTHDAVASINGPDAVREDLVLRDNGGDATYGTCEQAQHGSLKVLAWRQHETGALFLAASKTHPGGIGRDAYAVGRDDFAARAALGGRDALGCLWPPAKIESVMGLYGATAPTDMAADCAEDATLVNVVTVGNPSCPFVMEGHGNGNNNNNTRGNSTNATMTHMRAIRPTPHTQVPVLGPFHGPAAPATPHSTIPKVPVSGSANHLTMTLGSIFTGLIVVVLAF